MSEKKKRGPGRPRKNKTKLEQLNQSHGMDERVQKAKELEEARDTLTETEIAEEFGDLLFVMVNLGRHLGLDPENALRATNAKFTRRFEKVEEKLADRGKTPSQSTLEEMDALWDEVKSDEKNRK